MSHRSSKQRIFHKICFQVIPQNSKKDIAQVGGQHDDDEPQADADHAGQLHATEGHIGVEEQVRDCRESKDIYMVSTGQGDKSTLGQTLDSGPM